MEKKLALLELEIKALNIINESLREEIVQLHVRISNSKYYNSAMEDCLTGILKSKERSDFEAIIFKITSHRSVWGGR